MQEDALKLVLLALEDGSALSRKVLVLFVVQKLEARFPQASKTSIGHVVQLLYRASCFKVTKRDEDSSLMQLKEEFRTYEALRREHDAQIVHIAMEAGLRISPEQWSSLLYGDLVHKSHMQSIIDKLQSPESFAKSVQELTIVLQRTGDPANLASLRPHLELLANIDHNPDDTAPPWEELESVMLAVKLVVHGLVEFIQNFSKKSHDTPQPQTNSKYKTSMCRDLRQQGGCPRGTNCTFAHTQDELEKFRLRNKKSCSVGRTLPLVLGKTFALDGTLLNDLPPQSLNGAAENPETLTEEVSGRSHSHLISRGADMMEETKRTVPSRSIGSSANSASEQFSPPRAPVSHSSTSSPSNTASRAEGGNHLSKHIPFIMRAQLPSQASELYFHENHPTFDPGHYQPGSCSYYPSPLHPPHKHCMARFLRSSNVLESPLPPSLGPTTTLYPGDPQTPHPPTTSSAGYAPHPSRDRLGPHAFHHHPGQPLYGPPHGIYAPLYDTRRVWRPQLYHREDARSNSLPPEVLHSSVYQPPLRERFNSLDSNYCSSSEHRAGLHRDFGRVPLGYEDLFRRKQEQWAHHHHHHSASRPSQSSPIFAIDFGTEHVESGGGQCVGCRMRSDSHYSPWSCGTMGRRLSPFEPETVTQTPPLACADQQEVDHNSSGGGTAVGKRWIHTLDHYRRLKEEDPIIPFSEGPIISKWGAISRASRTDFHTTDPVQATACQRSSSTTPVSFKDYNPHLDHSDYRWGSRGSDSSSHSSFLESEQLCVSKSLDRRTSVSSGEQILSDCPTHPSVYSQHQISEQEPCEPEPDRDIELELCAMDLEDSDRTQDKTQECVNRTASHSQESSCLLPTPCSSPLISSHMEDLHPTEGLSAEKMDSHLLKKMAFRKSLSPGALVSGGPGVSKLLLRTGPHRLGDSSPVSCPENQAELLLNRS